MEFDYGDSGSRYIIREPVGKGSYGVVYSAYDVKTKENVAIKRINNVFEHNKCYVKYGYGKLSRHIDRRTK